MAEPTPKSPEMNHMLSALAGRDREETIRADLCMTCGGRARIFRDTLSAREYCTSGMCQVCQDSVYGAPLEPPV